MHEGGKRLMDRKIGMSMRFRMRAMKSRCVCNFKRRVAHRRIKICEDMKMEYRTLSVDEAEQFWSLMNQLDYYMARVRKILVYTTMTYDISRY